MLAFLLALSVLAALVPAIELPRAEAATAKGALRPVKAVPIAKSGARAGGKAGKVATAPAAARFAQRTVRKVALRAGAFSAVQGAPVFVGGLRDKSGTDLAGTAKVEVLNRDTAVRRFEKAAVLGVTVTPDRAGASSVLVRADYSGFAKAYGADYAGRLRLYSVPTCFEDTPARAACRPVALKTNRDAKSQILEASAPVQPAAPARKAAEPTAEKTAEPTTQKTAEKSAEAIAGKPASKSIGTQAVTAAATGQAVVMAAAGPSSSAGSFTATPLQPSSSWEVGLNSGNFSYSYPVPVPPTVGGATPDLALAYDSQSVDGRTTETNGQVSWVGQGWDLQTGFIERRFNSCRDDGQAFDDLCWGGAPYVININGASHDLIPLPTDPPLTQFRFRDDSGWKVVRETGSANNEDNDGEWFRVTSPEGTQYWFGYGKTPWSTSAASHSAWTVPVFGDDVNEPCHTSEFATSRCQQAWRWNVDRVLDKRGNAIGYDYVNEQNQYAVRAKGTTTGLYDRGGFIRNVTYGAIASGSLSPSTEGSEPTSKVTFNYAFRCTAAISDPTKTCPTPAAATGAEYPDTPIDLVCSSAATSCPPTLASPTFFTAVRLTDIQTSRRTSSTASWSVVDTVTLAHEFRDPDNGTETAELWLKSIGRGGSAPGSAVSTPAVTFAPVYLDNRVDPASGEAALSKPRVYRVLNELGNRITVHYGHEPDQGCTRTTIPQGATAIANNGKECFPRWWTPPGGTAKLSWFHKYVVTRTDNENLPTGGVLTDPTATTQSSDPQVTTYHYEHGAAWHHDDDVNASLAKQSWSDWRGYASVVVKQHKVFDGKVSPTINRSYTRYIFYRGMHGDATPTTATDGTTKAVDIHTTEVANLQDTAYLRGRIAETLQYSTDGATLKHRTFTAFDAFKTADTVEHTSMVSRDAWMVSEKENRDRWVRNDGSVRKTKSVNTIFESSDPTSIESGVVTKVEDQGDEAVSSDSRCTLTDYVWNTSVWLLRTARTRTYSGPCATVGNQLTRNDSLFDGQAYATGETATLTRGEETETDAYLDATTTKIRTYADYDRYGRQISATDGKGNVSTTTYTPAIGIATSVKATGPVVGGTVGSLSTTSTLEYRRGLPTETVDANGRTTSITYDGLGRLSAVWQPGQQPKTATAAPSLKFSYLVDQTATSKTVTESLLKGSTTTNAVYLPTYTLVDGLGRTVQTQRPAPNGTDRVVDLMMYDDQGKVRDAANGVNATGRAGIGYLNLDRDTLPNVTRTTYDPLGRPLLEATVSNGTQQWGRGHEYDANDETVTPPTGGKISYTKNARELTTKVTEYRADASVYATTLLGYDDRDALKTVTSPKGKVATYATDWLGRRTSIADPDAGNSSITYDDNGNIRTTTDARGTAVTTDYDVLDRPTRRYTGTAASPSVLTSWEYDTVAGGKGMAASSTARVTTPTGGTADYTTSITGYDSAGRVSSTKWAVPAAFGVPSAQTYTETYGYDPAGHVTSLGLPAIGELPAETVTAAWTDVGVPSGLATSSGGTLVASTSFDTKGRLAGRRWGDAASGPQRTYGWDGLDRLASVKTATGSAGTVAQNDAYTYAGPNLGRVTDAVSGQRECYGYDDLRRLTRAWTTNADCTDAAAPNRTFGPGPYDQSWSFDTDNSITAFADAAATGGASSTAYSGYYGAGSPAHAPTTATTTGSGAGTVASTFDASGYLLTSAPSTGSQQKLTWDPLHQLASSTTGTAATRFAYAADGGRLVRQTPTESTVTMGSSEVVFPVAGGAATGRRSYTLGGSDVAVRTSGGTGTGLSWLAADDQSSNEVSINASTQAVSRTRYTPYGKVRATSGGLGTLGTGLPTDKGFLGKTFDVTTGLNELGARYYQAGSGMFTAPDPIAAPTDPRSLNPYTYSQGNPIGFSDPSGLRLVGCEMCRPGSAQDPARNWVPQRTASGRSVWAPIVRRRAPMGPPSPGNTRRAVTSTAAAVAKAAPEKHRNIWQNIGSGFKNVAGGFGNGLYVLGPGTIGMGLDVVGLDSGADFIENRRKSMESWFSADQDSWTYKAGSFAGENWNIPHDLAKGGVKFVGHQFEEQAEESAARRVVTSCSRNSFAAETPVVLADGSRVPISKIKVGDVVQAVDPATGEKTTAEVTATFLNQDKDFTDLTFTEATGMAGQGDPAGAGPRTITLHTTSHHPIWDATSGEFVDAVDLPIGHQARTDDGSTWVLQSFGSWAGSQWMYDLTVDKVHTFYVTADNVPLLVHNCGPGDGAPEIKAGSSGGETAGDRFSGATRAKALEENPDVCVYCRMVTDSPQVDHVIPRARGGNATIENAQTACGHCNASKGARDFPLSPPQGYRGTWPPLWWGQ